MCIVEGDFIYQYLINEMTGEYDMLSVLRQTDRGVIYLMRHRRTGTSHVLLSHIGTDDVYRQLMYISCPYLPRVEEVAVRDDHVLVLEDYVPGDNLAERLEVSLPTRREVLKIVRQLCHALWAIHAFGAVHRDVKPDNIILSGSDAILIDFDASRITKTDRTADTQILGTTGYAAPEQFGIGQTDARTDIYSLGVLLNVMLTGQHPSVCKADGFLGYIVQRCTMINPADRFQDTAALLRALPPF